MNSYEFKMTGPDNETVVICLDALGIAPAMTKLQTTRAYQRCIPHTTHIEMIENDSHGASTSLVASVAPG